MANRRASIWMYVKVGARWRYVKPVVGKNNKLRPGYAVIGGVENTQRIREIQRRLPVQ